MARSVAARGGSPAAAFLNALQRDLYTFGRSDTALINVGEYTVFAWDEKLKPTASEALRRAALKFRLRGKKASLTGIEASLPPGFFVPFTIKSHEINPEVILCERHSQEEVIFDYVALAQSLSAEVSTMRSGKFLVYDASQRPRRLMGAIGLKSPIYFNGARDTHLGWPPLFEWSCGHKIKNEESFRLRDRAFKSIYNIGVCMLTSPYSVLRAGRLLSSLCFSPPIIHDLEARYGDPILGLTTTGGWGGSAAQYERIRLGFPASPNGTRLHLYVRTHCRRPTLNIPYHLFSESVFEAAYATVKASAEAARPFANYRSNPTVRSKMLHVACRLLRLPRAAIATNIVAHYFGSVSDACRQSLKSLDGLTQSPIERTIPIGDILSAWRSKSRPEILSQVEASRLSAEAT